MLKLSPQEVVSTLLDRFDRLPARPGVYILRNLNEVPIYIGKATSIKNRVQAHLKPRPDDPIGQLLKDQIHSADYIFTREPLEALILENVLIKRYKPRYNIRLKDDKSYPYIKITGEKVPRVLVTRSVEDDGSRYFGPYGNAKAARRTVKYLRKIFPIRSCSLPLDWNRKFKACIDHSIGLCKAPCIFSVSKREYDQDVTRFGLFLEGKLVQLSKMMYNEMWRASENEEFEEASKIRDNIKSLESTALKQRIMFSRQSRDKDVITVARQENRVITVVFQMREGRVIGREKFIIDGVSPLSKDYEIISAFIKQHYASAVNRTGEMPNEIVLPVELPDSEEVQTLLSSIWTDSKKPALVLYSSSQENRQLARLAQDNAVLVLREQESKDESRRRERLRSLKDLKERLNLEKLPRRIECFDISNIHGEEAVGAMTVFVDGFPEKSQYRKFRIKTVHGIDDYSMMSEMIGRRFRRLRDSDNGRWAKGQPDLVIIDGGRGHLNAALKEMHAEGIFGIPTISLAKKEELVFLPSRTSPIRLSRDSEALHVLQHIRDQAHRFGISYHRRLRSRKITRSALDEIPGIGEKRKRNLLAHFGSVNAIRRSSIEEIVQVAKINEKLASEIIMKLNE